MEKFYKKVSISEYHSGWIVSLDEKTLKTPQNNKLILPTKNLATAILNEWDGQDTEVDPMSMPLTRLANSTIDKTQAKRKKAIEKICSYAHTDAGCYQIEEPKDLVERQVAEWAPLLEWLYEEWGIKLLITKGIKQIEQTKETIERVLDIVSSYNDFGLTSLHALTDDCSSIVIALAVMEGQLNIERALCCATLEQQHQMSLWGEDPAILCQHNELRDDISNAYQFHILSSNSRYIKN